MNLEQMVERSRLLWGYAPTPIGRLASLGLEALDAGDLDMARICLVRLAALGAKK